MKESIDLSKVFAVTDQNAPRRLEVFALMALRIVDSLESGFMTPGEATAKFFNATNGKYVRSDLRDELADEFMSRGVQLSDLFETLPAQEANEEYQRELAAMRKLGQALLDRFRIAA